MFYHGKYRAQSNCGMNKTDIGNFRLLGGGGIENRLLQGGQTEDRGTINGTLQYFYNYTSELEWKEPCINL